MKLHVLFSVLVLTALTVSCASQQAAPPTPKSLPAAKETATPSKGEQVATDPTTFSLASGKLQLVEFFSFT